MQKTKRKTFPLLLGSIVVLVIIFINTTLGSFGGEKGKGEESREYAELEKALMSIEGIGEVIIYPHYEKGEKPADPLSDYFSLSGRSNKTGNPLQGILVVAEGADDMRMKNRMKQILSSVLQLPEHRIVIEEMKKRGTQLESE